MFLPLTLVLSVPALLWFANHWTLFSDSGRYLLAASELISGRAFEDLNSISEFNGGHGPAFPALIGALIVVFGRDTEELVWVMRLMALLNPLLAYLLTGRLSSPAGGLVAAALVALLGYNAEEKSALNIDAPLLTFYLLALLALLAAIERNNSVLALLSGALLGVSILTKETALANLPLALLAVLLLDWELRGALWHYLGVVLVCLPWWVWVWSATGEVYLVDRLPTPLQGPLLVAGAVFSVLAAVGYASGLISRFLAGERRRRWGGWFVVVAWSVALSGMLLATATYALGKVTLEAIRVYLANDVLFPAIVSVPTLFVVVGYACWKALGQDAPVVWRLLTVALLFQAPVCLLLVVERWLPRQFLVPQTLVLCALAALVVNAGKAALERRRDLPTRLMGALVAAVLAGVVLVACVGRVQALLPEDPAGALSGQHRVAPQEAHMVDWMAENISKGEHILVVAEPLINKEQAYMMYLDGGRHEWTKLRLDQGLCEPRPNVQIRCDPARNDVSRIPPDAIWVQQMTKKMGECKFMSLSMSNLLDQLRREDSDYVMIAGPHELRYAELPSPLLESKAFEVAHAELAREAESDGALGVVLLERTGLAPRMPPTQMNAKTVRSLKRCGQAQGPGPHKKGPETGTAFTPWTFASSVDEQAILSRGRRFREGAYARGRALTPAFCHDRQAPLKGRFFPKSRPYRSREEPSDGVERQPQRHDNNRQRKVHDGRVVGDSDLFPLHTLEIFGLLRSAGINSFQAIERESCPKPHPKTDQASPESCGARLRTSTPGSWSILSCEGSRTVRCRKNASSITYSKTHSISLTTLALWLWRASVQ